MNNHRNHFLAVSAASALSAMGQDNFPGQWHNPTGSLVGAGTTPVWHTSQLSQEESSLRSTLSLPSGADSHPVYARHPLSPATPRIHPAMSIENLIHPSNIFTAESPMKRTTPSGGFTPMNSYKISQPRKTPTNSASFALQTGRSLLDLQIDMNQIDTYEVFDNGERTLHADDSLMVDKDDGRMWHMGNDMEGSYSGTFINDDPEKYETFARNFANQIREEREAPARTAQIVLILDQVRKLVGEGSALSVHRTSYVEDGEPILCDRPGCYHKEALPADAYYVNVGSDFTFCLRCFELLWAGKLTGGLPADDPFRRDSAISLSHMQVDGPADCANPLRRSQRLNPTERAPQDKSASSVAPSIPPDSDLFKSRWAVPEDKAQYISPQRTPERPAKIAVDEKDEAEENSPSSVTSDGQWVYPPTEIQHIAHLIEAGASLSEVDKAALALWQAASRSQLRWERHLEKVKATRAYYAGLAKEDIGLYAKPLELGEEVEMCELNKMQAKTGMRLKDCNGRELTWVLKEAARKKD